MEMGLAFRHEAKTSFFWARRRLEWLSDADAKEYHGMRKEPNDFMVSGGCVIGKKIVNKILI